MSKFQNRRIVRVKIESTYNTDAAPGDSDSLQVAGLVWKLSDTKLAERTIASGTKTPPPAVYAGSLVELTFECELKGSGAAGTPPDIGPLLEACGLIHVNTPATSDIYYSSSTDEKSATIWFKDGGDEDEFRLTGCRGQVTFDVAAGEFGKASFTIRGHIGQLPAATSAWSPTYDATVPVPVLNKPLVIGGDTFEQSKISIDFGNELASPAVLNQADGFGEIRITKRAPKISATIFPFAAATASPLVDLTGNAVQTLTMATVGSAAGNLWAFSFPGGGTYQSIDDGESDGIVSYDVTLALVETALGADDEFAISFL